MKKRSKAAKVSHGANQGIREDSMLRTRWIGRLALLTAISGAVFRAGWADDLEESFRAPPEAAWPWCYAFSGNGNITRKGITADLEAMGEVGPRRP